MFKIQMSETKTVKILNFGFVILILFRISIFGFSA